MAHTITPSTEQIRRLVRLYHELHTKQSALQRAFGTPSVSLCNLNALAHTVTEYMGIPEVSFLSAYHILDNDTVDITEKMARLEALVPAEDTTL